MRSSRHGLLGECVVLGRRAKDGRHGIDVCGRIAGLDQVGSCQGLRLGRRHEFGLARVFLVEPGEFCAVELISGPLRGGVGRTMPITLFCIKD